MNLLANAGMVKKRPNRASFVVAASCTIASEILVEEEPEDPIYFMVVEDRLGNRLPEKISELELLREGILVLLVFVFGRNFFRPCCQ